MTLKPWNWLKMRVSTKKSVMVIKILQMICIGHAVKLLDYASRHCCRILSGKLQSKAFNHSIEMRNYLLKNNFKFNLQEHHFVYVYEAIIKCDLNFITCLYFCLALIRWNSSHCHLMELFKSKESSKEKFDSNNNWNTTWPRRILECWVL